MSLTALLAVYTVGLSVVSFELFHIAVYHCNQSFKMAVRLS